MERDWESFVRSHPDNKTAWYLLGREYAEKGDWAQAVYCFVRAGEVFEVFENAPLPKTWLEAFSFAERGERGVSRRTVDLAPWPAERSRVGGRIWRTTLLLILWTLLALDFDRPGVPADASSDTSVPAPVATPASAVAVSPPFGAAGKPRIVWSSPGAIRSDAAAWLTALFWPGTGAAFGDRDLRDLTVLLLPESSGWLYWRPQPALRAVSAGPPGAGWRVEMFDASLCGCAPADASPVSAIVPAWQDEREQEIVLRSAIVQYRRLYGEWPASPAALVRDYPYNVLSGLTPWMEENFAETAARARQGEEKGGAASGVVGAEPLSGGEWLAEPLAIVVDKARHRLALVSGPVVLREYPVGLGGERTPEGTFRISEKVRHPRGKRPGEYGTRGMVLDDTSYAIHGTSEPDSIGRDESLGCVRMHNDDIEDLFKLVPLGAPVTIGRELLPSDPAGSPGESAATGPLVRKPGYDVPATAKEENPKKRYSWLRG